MLQDNPVLVLLKQKLNSQTARVEGMVKSSSKGFGFLEVDPQKSYFIPPAYMKKVMHGDRICASIQIDKDREIAEPKILIEPFLTRFVGQIDNKNDRLFIIPEHPMIKDAIQCRLKSNLQHVFATGDWVVAKMCQHPLNCDDGVFYAEITEFITNISDYFAQWWITLSRHNLERAAPNISIPQEIIDEGLLREDLTDLNFITIDSDNTEDMDDALHAKLLADGSFNLTIAIADPTAYISNNSQIDKIAAQRLFTVYLPSLNIPMLPRKLSDEICSLQPNKIRPVLACRVNISSDGTMNKDVHFFAAWIKAKAKLAYDHVSDWLENKSKWKPENESIAEQIRLLYNLCLARSEWRQLHALVFKERPNFRFLLNEKAEVLNIITEHRRIANRIVEEAMILANICAAMVLRDKLGFGIYNIHYGFDKVNIEQVVSLLSNYGITIDRLTINTLEGFRNLRRKLDALPNQFLNSRIRRFQSFAEMSTSPGPHFGLGLDAYATWTSPIRKYGDMVNHRLLKSIVKGEYCIKRPSNKLTLKIIEKRRQNRMAERDIGDWLYSRFLKKYVGTNQAFIAEIIDISRGAIRVRLQENGAIAFIPATFIHSIRNEIICSSENGNVQINGKILYQLTDLIKIIIVEVRLETRSILARPVC